jgi:hypothetical protein
MKADVSTEHDFATCTESSVLSLQVDREGDGVTTKSHLHVHDLGELGNALMSLHAVLAEVQHAAMAGLLAVMMSDDGPELTAEELDSFTRIIQTGRP